MLKSDLDMNKFIFGCVALAAASAAHADIIPSLTVSSPIKVGSLYQYTYTATLAADQALLTGNYFTIYDFQGFVNFGTLGTGFSGMTSLLGMTSSRVNPTDSASVLNATFTYSGPTINMPMGGGQGTSTELGTFQIFSRFNGLGLIDFSSQGTKNNGVAIGTLIDNVGQTAGPLDGGGIGAGVPEPEAWAMLVVGFGVVGFSARRRRSVQVAA